MKIIHVSAECYPVAKVGGLGDVAGALPKYQCTAGLDAKLVMPMHRTKYLYNHEWENAFQGRTHIGTHWFDFTVIREKSNELGFGLYLLDINRLTDRERVYGYDDDSYRYLAFQIAVIHWLSQWAEQPDIIHCHDHTTGLIPFMAKYCYEYHSLQHVPTIFTIHNAQYQGQMGWDKKELIPTFDPWKGGLLEWNNDINPIASAVKNAWKVNTVSEGYLHELRYNSNGLEALFEYEKGKCYGILNGIDTQLWNPATDSFLDHHYDTETFVQGKAANKQSICERFGLDANKPLFSFIGRLVEEKAADILPDAILSCLYLLKEQCVFILLGSGQQETEMQLASINGVYPKLYHADIGYDEALSHLLYSGSDFLLMPSRVEPCGLNQLYAMRYGTVPIVRRTGGLQDTVKDVGDGGWGFCFEHAAPEDVIYSVGRAIELFHHPDELKKVIARGMSINHSWENTVQQYLELYQSTTV
ncbi:MAG: glycogen/starch synthase [Chitinophagaceae bacterium]